MSKIKLYSIYTDEAIGFIELKLEQLKEMRKHLRWNKFKKIFKRSGFGII